jgi:hypothetical protein
MMSKRVDPAVAWLSSLVAPLSPKEFLLQQAAELLSGSGQGKPPFDPKKATPSSVKRVEITRLSRDGMLIPVEGGFILKLNSQRPLVRQNFACAHEIGHTFFYDLSGPRPWRPYESMSSYWAEEDLCYQFAEEMLMPSLEITRIGGKIPPSLASFQRLLTTFQVSVEALARRIRRLSLWQCILIVMVASEGKKNLLGRKVIYKYTDYKSRIINWDALLPVVGTLDNLTANSAVPKKSTLSASQMFRNVKKDSQWSIEYCGFRGATAKTVVCIAVPK